MRKSKRGIKDNKVKKIFYLWKVTSIVRNVGANKNLMIVIIIKIMNTPLDYDKQMNIIFYALVHWINTLFISTLK